MVEKLTKSKREPKTKPVPDTSLVKPQETFQPIVLSADKTRVGTIYDPLSGVTYTLDENGKIIGRETDR